MGHPCIRAATVRERTETPLPHSQGSVNKKNGAYETLHESLSRNLPGEDLVLEYDSFCPAFHGCAAPRELKFAARWGYRDRR